MCILYYSPGASEIIGLECAGIIVDLNNVQTDKYKVGSRVMCLLGGGGYAEYVAVPIECCMPVPQHLDWIEAGAIPEVWLTAYQLMRTIGQLQQGQTILIHAGASGVGTSAIQLCKLFSARSIVTAGAKDKLEFCKELGASAAFNYKDKSFGQEVQQYLKQNNIKSVDVVIDPVGSSHFNDNIDVLGLDGKYVLFGTMGGVDVELNLGKVLGKRIQLIGTTLRSRSNEYKGRLVDDFTRHVIPAFNNQTVKPIIHTTMSMDQIVDAHKLMESNATIGKIVIQVAKQ